MKKLFGSIFIAWLLVFTLTAPAIAETQDMYAYVYRDTGKLGADGRAVLERVESGISFWVLAVDTDTLETITYPGASTSLTNPVSASNFASTSVCNKMVAFRVDPTDATNDRYVDLVVRDNAGGFTEVIKNFDKYTHTVVINEKIGVPHIGIYRMGVIGTSNSEHYTGIRFLSDTIIQDVRVKVITATAGTLGVGLATTSTGSPKGLIDGLSLATTGIVPDPAFSTTAQSTKYGDLFAQYPAASGPGGPIRAGFAVTGSSRSYLTVTVNSTTGGNSNIFYWFTRIM